MLFIWIDERLIIEKGFFYTAVGMCRNGHRPDHIIIHPNELANVNPHDKVRAASYLGRIYHCLHFGGTPREQRVHIVEYKS